LSHQGSYLVTITVYRIRKPKEWNIYLFDKCPKKICLPSAKKTLAKSISLFSVFSQHSEKLLFVSFLFSESFYVPLGKASGTIWHYC
jgi:hypothetical protein